MAVVTMRQLLEAGVHFGHQTRRWNPKMKRFIFGERNGIYIIDLNQTLERIDVAYSFVRDLVADNGSVLFVGTKKQTQDPIARYADQCGMPYINERWLGGMLTNFSTIAGRVKKMQEYERMRSAGDFEAMPKKEALILSRELDKLQRNLGGIRGMSRLPEAVFIIDTKKEHIAVTEANKLNIPIVAVVDTNCDPDLIDYVIPGNDDAIRAGTLMCRIIADAVEEGRFIASRRASRNGVQAAGPPVLDPEEEARRAEQQREARRQAAIAQADREARLTSGATPQTAATQPPATQPPTTQPPATQPAGSAEAETASEPPAPSAEAPAPAPEASGSGDGGTSTAPTTDGPTADPTTAGPTADPTTAPPTAAPATPTPAVPTPAVPTPPTTPEAVSTEE
ncbi:MAG TPA: 30S ribosomal protein S2 [Acidimicrobiales bacterium]